MEGTEDGSGRGEQWLPRERLPPVPRQDDESRRRREPGYCFILLFPNSPAKPESRDQRLKTLVTGSWPGWEMVRATGDATDGRDGA